MLVLSCNVGSTSLKYRVYQLDEEETDLARGAFEGVGRQTGSSRQQAGDSARESRQAAAGYGEAILDMLDFLQQAGVLPQGKPDCVAFKTVAALGYTGVQLLDEQVLNAMEVLSGLLPAHNPPYICAIRQFAQLMPGVPLVGSFETGFFSDMPAKAYLYPLPVQWAAQGIRRNGAHGASHEYVAQWVSQRQGGADLRLITCHLGGSSSLAATAGGRGVDTTIGLSLQTGLAHNNRTGDIDPYLTFYLHEKLGYSLDEIKTIYATQSGLLGMSGGISSDLRVIEQEAQAGNAACRQALEAYCYQLSKQIGAFAAALGGLDAVAFTGGIGQNSAFVRAMALAGLGFMGVAVDEERNRSAAPGTDISHPDAPVRIWVVATNEELIIARKAQAFLQTRANP